MLYCRSQLSAVAASILVIGCVDNLPTSPTLTAAANTSSVSTKRPGAALTAALDTTIAGTHLVGVITVTRFDQDATGALLASVVLSGTANGVPFTQAIPDVPAVLSGARSKAKLVSMVAAPAPSAASALTISQASAQQAGTCDILFLNLGPLHLDILGLVVDLSQVTLNIDAQSGAGNLLGNLLCAVVHLLDGPAILTAVSNILNQINAILAAL
jgi:hypothetical protein